MFRVIEIVEIGLTAYKKRKHKVAGNAFKDKVTDDDDLIKKKIKENEFDKYRGKLMERYSIFKKQLSRQQEMSAKMEIERRINERYQE